MKKLKAIFIILICTALSSYILISSTGSKTECVKDGHPATITSSGTTPTVSCGSNLQKCCVSKAKDSKYNNVYQPNDRLSVFIFDNNNDNLGKGYINVIANSLIDFNVPNINFDISMDGSSQSFTNYQEWENALPN